MQSSHWKFILIYYFLITHHVSNVGHRLSWILVSVSLLPFEKSPIKLFLIQFTPCTNPQFPQRARLQNQKLYCCLNRWLSVTVFSATHHNMRNDTGERDTVPCLTIQPQTKFKLFLQLSDTVRIFFYPASKKEKNPHYEASSSCNTVYRMFPRWINQKLSTLTA